MPSTPPHPRHLRLSRPEDPIRDHLPLGEPEGVPDRITVTSRSLERGGRPWFPVTGEIHYSRIPRARWSDVLGLARAGGLTSVATYIFWQAHEPRPGEFHWDDNLDLRAFVELAGRHGLDVIVRMGPWAHGEARFGGFPDWLLEQQVTTRTNDPAYLELVRRLYGQIVTQLRGLTHAEGGPVVGAQMDNELYDQPQHLAMLRTIAEDHGLQVPIWTATGWGGAQVPHTLLALYGAYADGFWECTDVEWPPFAAHHYRYSAVRDDLSVGADLRESLDGIVLDPDAVPLVDDRTLPFATCELGGGMHVAYHRRPLVTPDDVSALALAKIGSGSIWQGYYMYAGGTQRRGPHGTEQESHATGYPNDVPTRTYDFHGPISEYGQLRPHYHQLRRQHLWLAADGSALAGMTSTVGGGSESPDELRWAVRSDGHRGYAFVTTYQPARAPLAAQTGVQFTVELHDGEKVQMPSSPVDLPAGVSLVWPLRYPLSDELVLRSATAALVTRIDDDGGPIVVLSAHPEVPVELVLEGTHTVTGPVQTAPHGEHTVVTLSSPPGPDTLLTVAGVRILVLDQASADRLYRVELGGRPRLVLADAPILIEGEHLVLLSDQPERTLAVLPAIPTLTAAASSEHSQITAGPLSPAGWSTWTIHTPRAGSQPLAVPTLTTAPPAPRTLGGPMQRLSAPTDFTDAAHVHVPVPALADAHQVLLRVSWTGDAARAVVADEVVSDHFWHGRTWDIDLSAHREELARTGLTLQMFGWRAESGIWVDPSVRDVPDGVVLDRLDLITISRVVLETGS